MNPETNVLRTLLVDAPPAAVWKALTDPNLARLYMGAMPCCDLRPGKPVQWFAREESGDQTLVAKGILLAVLPGERLRYSYFPLASKLPDEPGSHTTVDFHLVPDGDASTRVEYWQGDFAGLPDAERRAREAGRAWVEHLVGLKRVAEEVWEAKAA
ncbi:MAG: SRPBCC domain-containing protein [Flavobacteriales bacterium]